MVHRNMRKAFNFIKLYVSYLLSSQIVQLKQQVQNQENKTNIQEKKIQSLESIITKLQKQNQGRKSRNGQTCTVIAWLCKIKLLTGILVIMNA